MISTVVRDVCCDVPASGSRSCRGGSCAILLRVTDGGAHRTRRAEVNSSTGSPMANESAASVNWVARNISKGGTVPSSSTARRSARRACGAARRTVCVCHRNWRCRTRSYSLLCCGTCSTSRGMKTPCVRAERCASSSTEARGANSSRFSGSTARRGQSSGSHGGGGSGSSSGQAFRRRSGRNGSGWRSCT